MTYICNFVGFVLAAFFNVYITDRLGFGVVSPLTNPPVITADLISISPLTSHQVITIGSGFQTIAYALQSWAPPFGLFCFSYFLAGIGIGLQDAQANAFISLLPNMMWKMSVAHAIYGKSLFFSLFIVLGTSFTFIEADEISHARSGSTGSASYRHPIRSASSTLVLPLPLLSRHLNLRKFDHLIPPNLAIH